MKEGNVTNEFNNFPDCFLLFVVPHSGPHSPGSLVPIRPDSNSRSRVERTFCKPVHKALSVISGSFAAGRVCFSGELGESCRSAF